MRKGLWIFVFLLSSCGLQQDNLDEIAHLILTNNLAAAEEKLASTTPLKSSKWKVILLQTIIEFRKENYAQSLKKSEELIAANSKHPAGYYYVGLSYFNMKQYTKADFFLQKSADKLYGSRFLETKPSDSQNVFAPTYIYDDLVFMIGLTKRFTGDVKNSIIYLQNCISRNYKLAETYFIIGEDYQLLGDSVNSREYFRLSWQNGNIDAPH